MLSAEGIVYGLPWYFDPGVFVGLELETISFALSSVQLNFGPRHVTMYVESSLALGTDDEESWELIDVQAPWTSSGLVRLVGKTVTEANGDADGTLTLVFDSGDVLAVFDDTDQYECYSITIEGAQIIV